MFTLKKVRVCARKLVLVDPSGTDGDIPGRLTDKRGCAHPRPRCLQMMGKLRLPGRKKKEAGQSVCCLWETWSELPAARTSPGPLCGQRPQAAQPSGAPSALEDSPGVPSPGSFCEARWWLWGRASRGLSQDTLSPGLPGSEEGPGLWPGPW